MTSDVITFVDKNRRVLELIQDVFSISKSGTNMTGISWSVQTCLRKKWLLKKYEHLMSDEWHPFQEGEPPKMDDFLKIVF